MQTCENWAQKRAFRREFIKIKKNILRHQKNSIFSLGSTAFFPLRRNPRRMMIPRKKWILNWKLENIFILRHIESIVVAIKEWFPIMKSSLHQSIDFRLLKRKPKSPSMARWKPKNSNYFCTEISSSQLFSDHENSIKIDSRDDVGVDVDNDDDLPIMGDIDSGDHDSNDMTRPRKIRR